MAEPDEPAHGPMPATDAALPCQRARICTPEEVAQAEAQMQAYCDASNP